MTINLINNLIVFALLQEVLQTVSLSRWKAAVAKKPVVMHFIACSYRWKNSKMNINKYLEYDGINSMMSGDWNTIQNRYIGSWNHLLRYSLPLFSIPYTWFCYHILSGIYLLISWLWDESSTTPRCFAVIIRNFGQSSTYKVMQCVITGSSESFTISTRSLVMMVMMMSYYHFV